MTSPKPVIRRHIVRGSATIRHMLYGPVMGSPATVLKSFEGRVCGMLEIKE